MEYTYVVRNDINGDTATVQANNGIGAKVTAHRIFIANDVQSDTARMSIVYAGENLEITEG